MIDPQDIASPVTRRPGELEDLGLIGCVVRVAGEVVMTAAGAAVMGHPAASVAWLANQLAAEEEGLRAGQLVFSGGVTAPVPVVAGGIPFVRRSLMRPCSPARRCPRPRIRVIAAEREHKAIGQFSDNYPDFDLETAYRAQRAFVQSWLDAGDRFVGYKLGLTSRIKQQAMGWWTLLLTLRLLVQFLAGEWVGSVPHREWPAPDALGPRSTPTGGQHEQRMPTLPARWPRPAAENLRAAAAKM